MYLWEVLHLTIRKMSKHVQRLGSELHESRERLRRAESHSSESDEEMGDSSGPSAAKQVVEEKDKPTEEMVERMEEKLEAAQADQKNLFLIIFQRFIMILSEHLVRCDTDNRDYNTHWYRWTIGRLQQVFLAVSHTRPINNFSAPRPGSDIIIIFAKKYFCLIDFYGLTF